MFMKTSLHKTMVEDCFDAECAIIRKELRQRERSFWKHPLTKLALLRKIPKGVGLTVKKKADMMPDMETI